MCDTKGRRKSGQMGLMVNKPVLRNLRGFESLSINKMFMLNYLLVNKKVFFISCKRVAREGSTFFFVPSLFTAVEGGDEQ